MPASGTRAPHQPRPTCDAAHELECRGLVRGRGSSSGWRLRCGARSAPMTLLADLEAFVHDHRSHGGLAGDATEPASNGYRRTVACACGVVFERWVTPDADSDLIRLASLN